AGGGNPAAGRRPRLRRSRRALSPLRRTGPLLVREAERRAHGRRRRAAGAGQARPWGGLPRRVRHDPGVRRAVGDQPGVYGRRRRRRRDRRAGELSLRLALRPLAPARGRRGRRMSRPRWCLLIHQLPPKPLYLRARIRQRLARVGAVALKNSVYVLPQSNRSVEDFQSIAEEAVDGGGEAFVGAVDFLGRPSDEEIEERFRRERAADYGEFSALARELLRQARRGGIGASAEGDLSSRASRLQKRLGEA